MPLTKLRQQLLQFRNVAAFMLLGIAGCTSHIAFVESSHLGLKATFKAESATPAEVDLGWKRTVAAMIPKQAVPNSSRHGAVTTEPALTNSASAASCGATILIEPDPDELMSLYTSYEANVGFADPITIRHFLATGIAANNLMASPDALKNLTHRLAVDRANKAAAEPPKDGK